MAVRLLSSALSKHWRSFVFEAMLGQKVLLLTVGAALAINFGPFQNGDSWQAVITVITGMVLVAAMATQNAVHRVYLGSAPPSTLMTGTTTQVMLDLADLFLVGSTGSQSRHRGAGTPAPPGSEHPKRLQHPLHHCHFPLW
jgi:uncharacterized membrane protein YoaK (UPF0700 family)